MDRSVRGVDVSKDERLDVENKVSQVEVEHCQ